MSSCLLSCTNTEPSSCLVMANAGDVAAVPLSAISTAAPIPASPRELLAKSRGYDSNGQQSTPWGALALEAFVDGPLLLHLRYRATAAAIAPLRDQSFSIQNLGPLYQPPPLAALFTLALELQTP